MADLALATRSSRRKGEVLTCREIALAQPSAGEGLGRPGCLARQLAHVLEAVARAEQPRDVVHARAEVVDREGVAERRLYIVAVRREREARTVELAASVVLIGRERNPAVLIEIEDALAVDVAL